MKCMEPSISCRILCLSSEKDVYEMCVSSLFFRPIIAGCLVYRLDVSFFAYYVLGFKRAESKGTNNYFAHC